MLLYRESRVGERNPHLRHPFSGGMEYQGRRGRDIQRLRICSVCVPVIQYDTEVLNRRSIFWGQKNTAWDLAGHGSKENGVKVSVHSPSRFTPI